MNKYTKRSHILKSAENILLNSDLLKQGDCMIVDRVLYEKLGKRKWRFFFDTDDYDYLEDKKTITKLEKLYIKRARL
jgi:hypothetical protein